MPEDVAAESGSIADQINRLREEVYKHYGKGAMTQLAEDLNEPYVEVCKALGETNAERLREIEKVVAGGEEG
jgi:hypothetical protein